MYLILATIFFATLMATLVITIGLITQRQFWRPIAKIFAVWIVLYSVFIVFGTGPIGQRLYVTPASSPYKLPLESGCLQICISRKPEFYESPGASLVRLGFLDGDRHGNFGRKSWYSREG